MKLKITVTEEIYRKSMYCGYSSFPASENCAIAHAVRDIFPDARVSYRAMIVNNLENRIPLPFEAQNLIRRFDDLTPEQRLELPETRFIIEVNDEIIDSINIEDIEKSLTLELV